MKMQSQKLAAAVWFALACAQAHAVTPDTLSTTIKPCDDFYGYANEVWTKTASIPDDRAYWGVFAEIKTRNEKILKDAIIEAAADPAKLKNPAIAKVAIYYASGVDTAKIEALGLAPLKPLFDEINALTSAKQLPQMLGKLQRMGLNVGTSTSISSDAKDRTRYLVQLGQGGLSLPERDYYIRTDAKSAQTRAAYKAFAQKFADMAAVDANTPTIKVIDAVYKLENEFAKASMTLVQQRDPKAVYNLMTIAQLSKIAPGFDWVAYFAEQKITVASVLNVGQPKFVTAFAKLTQTTSLADWKAYLQLRVLSDSASRLSGKYSDAHFAFFGTELDGKKTQRPRPERVLEQISGNYGEAPLAEGLGQLYVEKAFSPEAKIRAVAMTANIKAALRERLQNLAWMQPQTKEAAIKKLDAMALQIGYPDKWRDYSSVEIKADDYLGNWLRASTYNSDFWAAKLGTPVDRNQWWMSPQIVNAYAGEYNEIVFPAGILQPPFFDLKADDALNYGAIGMVIGHEITHHFDDQGRQFDATGNMKQWWTPKDDAAYKARAKALVTQYSNYRGAKNTPVNGKLTLGENIADLGGLTIAFMGLERALKAGAPAANIDGLTQQQRYFLSYAQSWREITREAAEIKGLLTDSHSPPRFRVQGPIAHLSSFANTFSCPAVAPALRAERDRVVIW